ncbi:MAG: hypothetical protein WAR79_13285 [Melioribacteraceae bacterium]
MNSNSQDTTIQITKKTHKRLIRFTKKNNLKIKYFVESLILDGISKVGNERKN